MKTISSISKARVLLLSLLFLFAAIVNAGAQNLHLSVKDKPLWSILKEITVQTGYKFVYSDALQGISDNVSFSYQAQDKPIGEALGKLFSGKGISFKITGKQIILTPTEIVPNNPSSQSRNDRSVKGIVTDEQGDPLPGVMIQNKTTKKLTASGFDGQYIIDASEGDVIFFSSIGMTDSETRIGKNSVFNLTMKPDVIALEDVIVTGYQTISKERATGSFVKVGVEELAKKPVVNISDALTGLTPGMSSYYDANSGKNHFLIRGQGSLQGASDRDPLVVVDGFPIAGEDPFSTINPSDVESVTILKDAAATSIYGARAANGVIVVTTKKSRMGQDKFSVNVNAFVSVSQKADLDYAFNMADTKNTLAYITNLQTYSNEYMKSWNDPYYSSTDPFKYMPKLTELYYECYVKKNITEDAFNLGYNQLLANEGKWEKEYNKHFFRNELTQQYNISLGGSSTKNRYNLSVNYNRGLGAAIGDENNRVILNFSNDYNILKNLTLSVGVNAQIANNKIDGVSVAALKAITSPYTSLFNEDGSYAHIASGSTMYEPILNTRFGNKLEYSWNYNPLEDRAYNHNEIKTFNTRFQAGLNYKIIDGLNISVKGQYERNEYKDRSQSDELSYRMRNYFNLYSKYNEAIDRYQTYLPKGASYIESGKLYTSYNMRGQIDYNKIFKEKHSFTAMLGGEIMSSTMNAEPRITRYGYNENTNAILTNPDYFNRVNNIFGASTYYPYASLGTLRTLEDRFLSAYLNLAYTYDNRYTVTASARTDASNFVSDELRNKFSPFWSVGAAWNLKREKFLQNAGWIENLKVRGSYGIAGVAAGKGSVSTLTTLYTYGGSVAYNNNESYNSIYVKGNPTLTWEKSRSLDIAVDFDLFGGKLFGTIDYYNRYSYDVLAMATVPFITQSQESSKYNNAEISNKGVEITLGSQQKIADKIFWTGNLNFSYNKNIVEKYNVIPIYPGSTGSYIEGRPLGCIYAFNAIGYTPEGLIKLQGKDGTIEIVKDRNTTHNYDVLDKSKGELTPDDNNWRYYYGTTVAPYNMGFTNTFRIYGFTLSFMVTGAFGHKFSRANEYRLSDSFTASSQSKSLANSLSEDYTGEFLNQPRYTEQNKDLYNTGYLYLYMGGMYSSTMKMYESANHIRLNEVFAGYDMPKRWFGREQGFIKALNVYVQARNLGMIWSASGVDPVYAPGNLKPFTTWTFGAKLNF